MKVTAQWIADQCGVSRGTVDRVVNGRPNVSPEVRERIQKLISEYGYKTPTQRQAARGVYRIGVILPSWDAFFIRRMRDGIRTAVHNRGLNDVTVLVEELKNRSPRSYFEAIGRMEERGIECSRAEENRLAAGCTGVRRTSGQHPGGVVVVPKEIEIYDVCPIQHPADDPDSDIITTHFEYHSIDANLLKLDELGHDDPTMIKHLENLTGVNAQEIPLDDPETMSLFHSCKALRYKGENPDTDPILGDLGCVAVPEFGTKFVRGMVKETHPSTFAELVSISGLSHGTDVWLGNAAELVRKGIPLSGCICCRDDIMNYLILQGVKPKLSFKTMESVRKGKGLTEEMETAMNEQHVPEWYIDSCKKIKYMFPKAHAVAYVMMAFRIAWFKVHKPLAFYSAYFSVRAKGFDASCMVKGDKVCLDKMAELKQKDRDKTISAAEKDMMTTLEVCHEFYRRGFTFEPMDVYASDATRFLVTENGLIPPFTSMPGIGEQAALSIVEERKNGRFLSAEEMIIRCPKASKAVVELLDQIGALGSMPKTTQMSLF